MCEETKKIQANGVFSLLQINCDKLGFFKNKTWNKNINYSETKAGLQHAVTSLFLAQISHGCTDQPPFLKVFGLIKLKKKEKKKEFKNN